MAEFQPGLLPEHKAPELNTTNPAGYTPNAEEKKALKLVDKLYQRAKAHKKSKAEKWMDWYKMFRGKQWKDQRPSYRHAEVINMVFQAIQTSVPILTDARPKMTFLPTEPSDVALAEILNLACESDWERGGWLQILTEALYDGHIVGAGILHMPVDAEGEAGLPQILLETTDPFYFFPDPNARNVNERRCRYVLTAEPVDLDVLKREYPDKADFLKPDLIDLVQGNKQELDTVRFKSPVDNRTMMEGQQSYDIQGRDQALKITLWTLSDDFDEEESAVKDEAGAPVLDPLTGQPKVEYIQKLKYPKGRKICVASGIVLEDVPNPYDDGKFPFVRVLNYADAREFWGISDVEQLESPQKTFNKLVSFALDVFTLMGNPIWVVDNNADVDTDNLFNRPGLVVEKAPGTEVRREQGVDVNPSLFGLIDRMREWFNDQSGNQEVSQGRRPEGITAMGAITALQEAAQTRLRLKSRHIDAALQELGQLWLSRAFQFYSAPRMFRVTANPEVQQYFKMHVEPVTDEMGQPVLGPDGTPQKKAVVRDYLQAQDGSYSESLEAREFLIAGKFDVKVGTGSSLPFAKAEKFAQAKEMYQLGVIDSEELLKTSDWPNWQAVHSRMEMKKQQEMMAQQAMSMGGPAPAGPGPATPAMPPEMAAPPMMPEGAPV